MSVAMCSDSWQRQSRSRLYWQAIVTWWGKDKISSARSSSRLFPM